MSWPTDMDTHPHAHEDACPDLRVSHTQARCAWQAIPHPPGLGTQQGLWDVSILLPRLCDFVRHTVD